MTNANSGPITALSAAQEQHMLFLFIPLKKGIVKKGMPSIPFGASPATTQGSATGGIDPRILTGVHFFMFYGLPADATPTPPLPVPSFQTAKGKDLLVVISIYDRDFAPYISAFTGDDKIAGGLNGLLLIMDETGIVPDTDHSSANYIWNHGGVAKNNNGFYKLLMRYNFSDPTIPAANVFPVNTPANPKFQLGATFPGLTVGWILENYPNAQTLWPLPPPKGGITFAPSAPPPTTTK